MNLKTIKDLDTPKLKGIKFEWIKEDGYPRELRLTDETGAPAGCSMGASTTACRRPP